MKKIVWFVSGFIFLAGFFIISPIIKLRHSPGADQSFLVSGAAGLIFIGVSLTYLHKKIR